MRSRSCMGFTLLELTISLAIVGFVSLIILSGLQVATRAWESGDRELEIQQRMRMLVDHLFEELKSSYNYILRIENKTFLLFKGESSKISFVSAADSVTSTFFPTGLKLVSIFVTKSGSGPQGLVIREVMIDNSEDMLDSLDDKEGVTYSLSPDVTDMKIRYYTYPPAQFFEDEQSKGEWTDFWGGETEEVQTSGEEAEADLTDYITRFSNIHLPTGLEITLTITDPNDDRKEITLPPYYIALQDCAVHSLISKTQITQRGTRK